MFVPFNFHWYEGVVPPFTGAAVNVTEVPGQTVVAEAEIDTLTGTSGLTVIVMAFDVAGLPVGQTALDVSEQVITLVLAGT
jgi:hypothetical protein